MPETDDQKKRAPPVSYRPPKHREEEFFNRAAASGLSVNAFITHAVFGKPRRHPAQLAELAKLLDQAAQISDRLHDIALTTAEYNALPIEQARAELSQIRAALLTLMGRKP